MSSRYNEFSIFGSASEPVIEDLQNYAKPKFLTCIVEELQVFYCEFLPDFSRKLGEKLTFFAFLLIKKTLFPTFYGVFFGKLIKNTSENILEKSIINKSMHLYLLFPTVKTAALYHVLIKSYSKNTHRPYILKWAVVLSTNVLGVSSRNTCRLFSLTYLSICYSIKFIYER